MAMPVFNDKSSDETGVDAHYPNSKTVQGFCTVNTEPLY